MAWLAVTCRLTPDSGTPHRQTCSLFTFIIVIKYIHIYIYIFEQDIIGRDTPGTKNHVKRHEHRSHLIFKTMPNPPKDVHSLYIQPTTYVLSVPIIFIFTWRHTMKLNFGEVFFLAAKNPSIRRDFSISFLHPNSCRP